VKLSPPWPCPSGAARATARGQFLVSPLRFEGDLARKWAIRVSVSGNTSVGRPNPSSESVQASEFVRPGSYFYRPRSAGECCEFPPVETSVGVPLVVEAALCPQ
jgi:hypothetical protein